MLIHVQPHIVGSLRLQPVKAEDRRMISQSNNYDGSCIAYLIDSQDVSNFLTTLSFEAKAEIDNGYTIQVEIDAWEFRHLVGGQRD